jgi:hypothetical protein
MSSKTTFLLLTLPDNGEFVDGWDNPLNANSELIDDHLDALNTNLVGSGGTSSSLKGSATHLAARLDVGMNADGTLKLDSATEFQALDKSKARPISGAATQAQRVIDRFDRAEEETVRLRNNIHTDRYGNTTAPTAEAGMGKQSAGFLAGGTAASTPVSTIGIESPIRGFVPNSIVDGPRELASPPYVPLHLGLLDSGNELAIAGSTATCAYNIDGMYFEVDFNLSIYVPALSLGSGTFYAYVDRNEAAYNTAASNSIPYKTWGGITLNAVGVNVDPRIMPTHASQKANADVATIPTDGVVNPSTPGASALTGTGTFQTAKVRAGDILVVTSPTSLAGEYVIDSLETGSEETQLNIEGEFNVSATVSNINYYITRRTMPSFGISSVNTAVPGRVYIGEVVVTANVVTGLTPYQYGGIYDSDWLPFNSSNNFVVAANHHLGTWPSQIEIWVRDTSGSEVELNPTIQLSVQNVDSAGVGAPTAAFDCPFPAFKVKADATTYSLTAFDPIGDTTVYTDFLGNDVLNNSATHQFRVILRR